MGRGAKNYQNKGAHDPLRDFPSLSMLKFITYYCVSVFRESLEAF
jgi:hypothetical protein